MEDGSFDLITNVLILLVCLGSVATLYALISPLLEGDVLKKRMTGIANERDNMRKQRLNELDNPHGPGLRPETKGFVKNLVDNLSLEKLLAAPDLKDKLSQAGMRGQRPIYLFYMFRLIMPIALFLFGVLYFVLLNPLDWRLMQSMVAAIRLPGQATGTMSAKQ